MEGSRPWLTLVQRIWNGALDALFPRPALCPGCQRPVRRGARGLCAGCLARLPLVTPPICVRCGRPLRGGAPGRDSGGFGDGGPQRASVFGGGFSLFQGVTGGGRRRRVRSAGESPAGKSPAGELCAGCRRAGHLFAVAWAPGVYDGALRDYIHRVKFGADRALGKALGRLLAEYALRTRELWPVDAVVPVPLHPQRLAERGFNQAELLARAVAHYCQRPLLLHVLERVRPTTAQARMPVQSRRANVRGAFRVREAAALAGRRLLLVDDVLTSGETAGEAARVLLRAGAARVHVLCLAVGVHEADWRARQREWSSQPSEGAAGL